MDKEFFRQIIHFEKKLRICWFDRNQYGVSTVENLDPQIIRKFFGKSTNIVQKPKTSGERI